MSCQYGKVVQSRRMKDKNGMSLLVGMKKKEERKEKEAVAGG